jgi:hypothetical protein
LVEVTVENSRTELECENIGQEVPPKVTASAKALRLE